MRPASRRRLSTITQTAPSQLKHPKHTALIPSTMCCAPHSGAHTRVTTGWPVRCKPGARRLRRVGTGRGLALSRRTQRSSSPRGPPADLPATRVQPHTGRGRERACKSPRR